MKERETLKCTEEEEDALARSTKKFEESHVETDENQENPFKNTTSYRDKLLREIPRAFEQAFGLSNDMDEDVQSDSETGDGTEGNLVVCLSREEKSRIRAVWRKALVIKAVGRKVRYNYLYPKIRSLWNPCGKMDCIDLDSDYFLIKFGLEEDVDRVLKGGPWFIGQQFLAIKRWELEFRALEATFSSVAVWVCLPELLIEYNDPAILRRIGKAIGLVLHIDAHMASGIRGCFARLCVQVNLDKPLAKTITIGTKLYYMKGLTLFASLMVELGIGWRNVRITLRRFIRSQF